MIRYITAGESHGPGLTGIVEGVPAGLPIHENDIAIHLARRQKGYGRGGRMAWEKDRAIISSGVRFGKTMAGPIALYLENRAFEKDKPQYRWSRGFFCFLRFLGRGTCKIGFLAVRSSF